MPHLLLADDHSIIRGGLKTVIKDFLPHSSFDEADDGDTAFEKIKHNDYDLVILDINMPGTDSIGLVSNIFALKPGIKILMFSMNDEELFAKRYLKMGVMGYIKKSELPVEIENAITTILQNKKYVSLNFTQVLIENLGKNTFSENPFNMLSAREFEVAQHLVCGESSSQICRILKIHPSTVGTYKTKIFVKLQCTNIIQLNTLAKMYDITPLT